MWLSWHPKSKADRSSDLSKDHWHDALFFNTYPCFHVLPQASYKYVYSVVDFIWLKGWSRSQNSINKLITNGISALIIIWCFHVQWNLLHFDTVLSRYHCDVYRTPVSYSSIRLLLLIIKSCIMLLTFLVHRMSEWRN